MFFAHHANALDPLQAPVNANISICEASNIGNLQYDLTIKGSGQMGTLTGTADSTNKRECGSDIAAIGHYSQQLDGSFFVTLTSMDGDSGACEPWVYQFIWSGTGGTGEVHFFNRQGVEPVQFTLGSCPVN